MNRIIVVSIILNLVNEIILNEMLDRRYGVNVFYKKKSSTRPETGTEIGLFK